VPPAGVQIQKAERSKLNQEQTGCLRRGASLVGDKWKVWEDAGSVKANRGLTGGWAFENRVGKQIGVGGRFCPPEGFERPRNEATSKSRGGNNFLWCLTSWTRRVNVTPNHKKKNQESEVEERRKFAPVSEREMKTCKHPLLLSKF